MALKETCKTIRTLLESIAKDIEKAEAGNKAAAQRVRTATIRLEKAAKLYRKESVTAAKTGELKRVKASLKKKKSAKPAKAKAAKAKAAPKRKAAAKKAPAKKASARKKKTVKPSSLARKRPSGKVAKRSKAKKKR